MTQRTPQQNKSLHKYFDLLAKELNDGGYDVQTVITVPVDFTRETVKKYLFKRIMSAMYPDKASTTELSTYEIGCVYENLNRITADRFGVSIPFPSEETKE